jgi:hypothetical protein
MDRLFQQLFPAEEMDCSEAGWAAVFTYARADFAGSGAGAGPVL